MRIALSSYFRDWFCAQIWIFHHLFGRLKVKSVAEQLSCCHRSLSSPLQLPTRPRLRNDLYCVEWGVKLYSLTHSPTRLYLNRRTLQAQEDRLLCVIMLYHYYIILFLNHFFFFSTLAVASLLPSRANKRVH